MSVTRKKKIGDWVERVLMWTFTFGWSATLMYFARSPQSAWIAWFTLVVGLLAIAATVVLFNFDLRYRITTYFWRRTQSK